MKHVGDITKLNGAELPIVDIITGGSPCQDLSVAGKRAGLAGERSGLFMEQIRIIKEMRDESIRQLSMRGATYTWRDIKPRYMVWENVPGAFSSNKGEDFRAVLEETARVVDQDAAIPGLEGGRWTPAGCIMGDGWSVAWRVHDAQFWGVPQRRKRIALVADFGGATASEILFERKGMSGDIEASGTTGKRVAGVTERDTEKTIYEPEYQVMQPKNDDTVYCLQANGIDRAETAGCNGKGWRENESYTLNTIDRHAVCAETYQKTTGTLNPGAHPGSYNGQDAYSDMLVVSESGGGEPTTASKASFFLNGRNDGKADTLVATDYKDPQLVCYGLDRASFNQGQNAQYDFSVEKEKAQTILSRGSGGGTNETVGALCARDFKGVGNQYVSEGKCIIQKKRTSTE